MGGTGLHSGDRSSCGLARGGGGAGSHWVPLGNALGVPEWSCCAGDRVGRGVFVSCPAVWARGALQQTAWALPGLEM